MTKRFRMIAGPNGSGKSTLAEEAGYRTYLYFVATSDIAINIARIASRVLSGGHSVPNEKVVSRSVRTLENVMPAVGIQRARECRLEAGLVHAALGRVDVVREGDEVCKDTTKC